MKKIIYIKLLVIFILVAVISIGIIEIIGRSRYAKSYSISNVSCTYVADDCSLLNFTFRPSEKTFKKIPEFTVDEIVEQGQSQITISNIGSVDTQFTYEQIAENPLVEGINYNYADKKYILTIDRKGPLVPVETSVSGSTLSIRIPDKGKSYPEFSDLFPKSDSVIGPYYQKISVKVAMSAALKDAFIILDGRQEKFTTENNGDNRYTFKLFKNLEAEKIYNIKVIAADAESRASAVIWEFKAQRLVNNIPLPADRFKYLGWWGQINKDEVKIMKEPNSQSEELHVFSKINRVKILEEVSGEVINNNDLWYKIDGGAHPGAFIFSADVIPVEQPVPPVKFEIPKIVKTGEYWIDVNLNKKILTLFQYDKPVFATYVATGRPTNPTIVGTYRVWYKLAKDRMQGGPPVVSYRYDLPNVPWVMYYSGAYGIHGTYWHDKFGTQQSAGCTNLTQGDAKFIFEKTLPIMPANKASVISSDSNPGTVVYNHY